MGQGSYDRCLQAIRFLLDRQIPLVLKSTAMTLNLSEILAIKRYVESLGTVKYKLGEEMRPELDGDAGPFQYALSEPDLADLNQRDPDLWRDACRQDALELPPCRSGMQRSTSMPMDNCSCAPVIACRGTICERVRFEPASMRRCRHSPATGKRIKRRPLSIP